MYERELVCEGRGEREGGSERERERRGEREKDSVCVCVISFLLPLQLTGLLIAMQNFEGL